MPDPSGDHLAGTCDEFDYSSPEAQHAVGEALEYVLEIRAERTGPLARRVAIYEWTLGLAVIPVMLGRGAVALARKIKRMTWAPR